MEALQKRRHIRLRFGRTVVERDGCLAMVGRMRIRMGMGMGWSCCIIQGRQGRQCFCFILAKLKRQEDECRGGGVL